MRFASSVLAALVALLPFASTVSAAPAPMVEVQRFAGVKRTGNYIVTFKKGVDRTASVSTQVVASASDSRLLFKQGVDSPRHEYDSEFLNGFAAKLSDEELEELRRNPDVEEIFEDGIMHTMETVTQ